MAHAMAERGILTFDCYGTLIDWERGILDALGTDDPAMLDRYHDIEAQLERTAWRPYREILDDIGAQLNGTRISESLPRWKPFADTNGALERLRAAGYKLGILSNVDDDLFAETRKHFTVDFDLVITAQQVRSYKPAHGHFLEAKKRIGDMPWRHCAQSNFHDIVPCNELGIANAWVNRKNETALPGGAPSMEVRDMRELSGAVGS